MSNSQKRSNDGNGTERSSKKQKDKSYYKKQSKVAGLKPNISGIFVSCTKSKEALCVRECYDLFNAYAEKLYGLGDAEGVVSNSEEGEDIESSIMKELVQMKQPHESHRFASIQTGTDCDLKRDEVHEVEKLGNLFSLICTQMYISGESFAGTFIPYIANAILQRNHARKTADYLKYNLKGIAIGNGWIDPIAQYNAYYTFSVEHNLLNGEYKKVAQEQLKRCMAVEKANTTIHLDACEQVLMLVLENSRKRYRSPFLFQYLPFPSTNPFDERKIFRVGSNETCVNQYDIRDHSDSYPSCGISWPYELTTISAYLRRADVIGAIHADAQKIGWVECNSGVSRGFTNDYSPPAVQLLPSILKQIQVLLYSGDQDLICNHNGTEDMIAEMTWNGAKGFQNLTATPWFVNNSLAGHMLSERNLTYVVVYNASHMVPYDLPVVSMDMMYRFMGLDKQNISKFPSSVGYQFDDSTTGEPASNNNQTSNEDNEVWDRYYNAGTATLIIVIFGVLCLGAFVLRGRLRRRRNKNQAMKSAVENGHEEMDELVVRTPEEIFGDSEDEDDRKNKGGRYVDDDGEDRVHLKSDEEL
ncbi:11604_t:CDS:10 [Acaulospora colombiana]|uniref:11604_t:CDS:1 n=1 Tax=Acaulospora colombiana TaxID=27376 RepID=A0ACA9KWK4_9GLOM|nr:11604_t:CDS:10 [Acaulospora colombiana]